MSERKYQLVSRSGKPVNLSRETFDHLDRRLEKALVKEGYCERSDYRLWAGADCIEAEIKNNVVLENAFLTAMNNMGYVARSIETVES